MKIRLGWFNTYLLVVLAALAVGLACGCQSPEKKRQKKMSIIRVHVESRVDSTNRAVRVVVSREQPMAFVAERMRCVRAEFLLQMIELVQEASHLQIGIDPQLRAAAMRGFADGSDLQPDKAFVGHGDLQLSWLGDDGRVGLIAPGYVRCAEAGIFFIRHGGERAQAFVEERVEAARQAAEQKVATILPKVQQTSDRAKELVSASQEAVSQFQKRVDDRVRQAIEGIQSAPELKREIQTLQERIVELEKRLGEMQKKP